ncbi:MAG: RNA polymerase sigma factor, partial [Dermatophilaceae bacterium]
RDAGPDDRLRLLLLCCHPAINRPAQVALTLRLVGGLTTDEIAAAHLTTEATITQRIVRAKRKIRDAKIPLTMPRRLDERVGAVLEVLYLIFNEGYLTHGGDTPTRTDLADEAIRLAEVTTQELAAIDSPARPAASGLLALMLYHRSRFETRFDRHGGMVRLAQQDRTRWDLVLIRRANDVLRGALAAQRPERYQLMAVIAGLHANARDAAETDWPAIVTAYTQLQQLDPSPVVRLGRVVAVGMADGPLAGLEAIESITGLDRQHSWHAVRADLLDRSGRREEARQHFARAAELATSAAERAEMHRRLHAAGG